MIVLRHILSILLLPATVTVFVPYLILSSRAFPLRSLAAVILGALMIGCGLALVFVTIRQFATLGRGTLAPWDPPKHLVVAGVYRHVRNPMISGVVLILLGETLIFRSRGLVEWALGFLVVNAIYIPLLEEPMLEGRFGDEYRQYKRHVPRWVPRRTAWTPPWT
ncbi:MAG: methyltransferase family protein [Thermoanaerobaculia bacterium]